MHVIKTLAPLSFPENDRGDIRHLPEQRRFGVPDSVPLDVAEKAVADGLAEWVGQAPSAAPAADAPSEEQIAAAIAQALTQGEWAVADLGKDGVVNVKPLAARVSQILGQTVRVTAADRDAVLATQTKPEQTGGDGGAGKPGSLV